MPKRLLIANDLPGLGKVALAASLPILAACQVEAVILPTVILSSHTGGFPQVFSQEISGAIQGFLDQWRLLDLQMDGLVTGYCTSSSVLESLAIFAKEKKIPLIVDPIMGDNGKLYTGFDVDYVNSMKKLASQADVLIPNLTEAALLTDTNFLGETYSRADIQDLLEKLAQLGPKHLLLTGVSFDQEQIGLAYLNNTTGQVSYAMNRKWNSSFFGTGDMVTTLAAAAYAEGLPLEASFPLILEFLDRSLNSTLSLKRDIKYGVYFEPHLANLSQAFVKLKGDNHERL